MKKVSVPDAPARLAELARASKAELDHNDNNSIGLTTALLAVISDAEDKAYKICYAGAANLCNIQTICYGEACKLYSQVVTAGGKIIGPDGEELDPKDFLEHVSDLGVLVGQMMVNSGTWRWASKERGGKRKRTYWWLEKVPDPQPETRSRPVVTDYKQTGLWKG